MSDAPQTWAECRARFAAVFGGGPGGEAIAVEWLREALEALYGGAQDPFDLPVARRGLALQKAAGALLALEEMGDVAFDLNLRGEVAATFARYWGGHVLPGPPWRLSPLENLPAWEELSSDFEEVAR